jgi:hypothetical protein
LEPLLLAPEAPARLVSAPDAVMLDAELDTGLLLDAELDAELDLKLDAE